MELDVLRLSRELDKRRGRRVGEEVAGEREQEERKREGRRKEPRGSGWTTDGLEYMARKETRGE